MRDPASPSSHGQSRELTGEPSSGRTVSDRCPGVFTPHPAADGALARVRLLGGSITPEQLAVLAHVAAQYGDGFVDLTGRANVQIRDIADVDSVADALVDAGLVPSTTHEKVRNIEVSPFTGRVGGLADLRPLAHELDDALRSDHSVAALSGRFLFGLDDGHTDIAVGGTDVCAVARSGTDGSVGFDIVVDGEIAGSVAHDSAVAQALLGVAHDFLELADGAWRIADLPESSRGDLMRVTRDRLDPPLEPGALATTGGDPRVGWFDQDDGRVLLGAVVELGRLPARLAEFIAAVEAPVVFTPDREILVCDLGEGVAETVVRVLAPMGLIFDAASSWAQVSSCAGAPGCSRGLAEVRADVKERVDSGPPVTEREHWVGCDRGCGSPREPHLRVEATGAGYRRTHE
ncbi:precorrin-3B synthase [Gordonia sp. 852002-50395_SCH5434458]|uniref:precorrin-3B synthase n=1 Tax=Gordonia sp. 852002-50395_SCH5434458 TaxID=1834090 RepID=UPI0009EF26DD|nr:precorrin-3B synthase [Gordonia sp. 852002-50395_SCH5434458]